LAEDGSEEISRLTNINPAKSIEPAKQETPKTSQSFESFMKDNKPQGSQTKTEGLSPFDLVAQGKGTLTTGPTNESILGQMNSAACILGDLQDQMNRKNLKLRQSHKYLLRNALTKAHKNIQVAARKTGVNITSTHPPFNRKNLAHKFLDLVTDSQNQLSNAQSKIQGLNTDGMSMNPGDLLLIQIKLAKAQQELEYSSVLLSTAVSDIKTLFNIQL